MLAYLVLRLHKAALFTVVEAFETFALTSSWSAFAAILRSLLQFGASQSRSSDINGVQSLCSKYMPYRPLTAFAYLLHSKRCAQTIRQAHLTNIALNHGSPHQNQPCLKNHAIPIAQSPHEGRLSACSRRRTRWILWKTWYRRRAKHDWILKRCRSRAVFLTTCLAIVRPRPPTCLTR